jgi:large subunit ribosomal protein L29
VKAKEIRNLSDEELISRLAQLREGLFKARVRASTKELDNIMLVRNTRRDIARVLTILREKGVKI